MLLHAQGTRSPHPVDSVAEIIVEDNGRGFDAEDDSEQGIALKNIRQRLEMMCGGHMTITPREGGGTMVTVTIPDNTAQSSPAASVTIPANPL